MKDKPSILVVDDQAQNIELLEAFLAPQGYEVLMAGSGEEALEKLSANMIDLVLLDVIMPGMDGFSLTRRIRQDNANLLLPIVLVTALRDTEDRIKGIEAGCDDFISKPIDKMELLARVRSLLKVKAYNDLLGNYREELELEVARRTEDLKPAKLEPPEWEIMKQHTVIGAKILGGSKAEYISIAETIALCHHEKWDGSGYPKGLKGKDIPITARIAAVADVFDALVSKRPYKEPFGVERALTIIDEGKGKHFDPDVVDAFFAIKDEILAIREGYGDKARPGADSQRGAPNVR